MNKKQKPTIGVIGHTGMVGSEVYNFYKRCGFKVAGYSIDQKENVPNSSWEEINKNTDIVFVCVPTPYDFNKKKSNFKIVEEALGKIGKGKRVVIKSTIWPGITEKLQKKYPNLVLLFNPEFLSRKSAKQDFEKPDRQIIGYTEKSKSVAKQILKLLPEGKYSKIVSSTEAELIKYAHNIFGAMRIIYANHLYEVSQKLKINYSNVRDGFAASVFVGPGTLRYMTIFHNRKRGFGGPCFPKDIASYIEFLNKIGVKGEVVKATRLENQRILSEQELTENKVEKL